MKIFQISMGGKYKKVIEVVDCLNQNICYFPKGKKIYWNEMNEQKYFFPNFFVVYLQQCLAVSDDVEKTRYNDFDCIIIS